MDTGEAVQEPMDPPTSQLWKLGGDQRPPRVASSDTASIRTLTASSSGIRKLHMKEGAKVGEGT